MLRMDLEGIRLGEIRKSEKDKYPMISLIFALQIFSPVLCGEVIE